jgi:hypothetical protein
MAAMTARIALAAVAVIVLMWVGVALRNAIVLEDAGNVIFRAEPRSRAEVDRSLSRIKSSEFLNPDPTGKIARARFLLLDDRPREALRLVDQVVADEPDNLAAWSIVYVAAREVDPARARQAVVAITRLDPVGAAKARLRR